MTTLIGLTELASIYGISKQTAATWSRRRDAPRPVADLAMGPVWDRDDWIAWREPHETVLMSVGFRDHHHYHTDHQGNKRECRGSLSMGVSSNGKDDPRGGTINVYCSQALVEIRQLQIVERNGKIVIIEVHDPEESQ